MRDEPMDAPLPDSFSEESYYSRSLKSELEEKEKYDSYSDEDWVKQWAEYVKAQVSYARDGIKKRNEERAKYEKMLEKVRKYVPPTPEHVNFANFMESQILESIQYDCNLEYYQESLKELENLTWEEYKNTMLECNKSSLEYARENLEKMKDSSKKVNDWILQLKESVAKVQD